MNKIKNMVKIIKCDVSYYKGRFMDYRSIIDSIYSDLVTGIHELEIMTGLRDKQIFLSCCFNTSIWIKKLDLIGAFEPKSRINYDGFSESYFGLLDGHEAHINEDIQKSRVVISMSLENPTDYVEIEIIEN